MENILVNYSSSTYSFQELSGLHKVIATEQTADNSEDKLNPEINWSVSQTLSPGYVLDDKILNAEAFYIGTNILGTFEYIPDKGYIVPDNISELNIHTKFTPSTESYDNSTYYDMFNIVEKDITINIS